MHSSNPRLPAHACMTTITSSHSVTMWQWSAYIHGRGMFKHVHTSLHHKIDQAFPIFLMCVGKTWEGLVTVSLINTHTHTHTHTQLLPLSSFILVTYRTRCRGVPRKFRNLGRWNCQLPCYSKFSCVWVGPWQTSRTIPQIETKWIYEHCRRNIQLWQMDCSVYHKWLLCGEMDFDCWGWEGDNGIDWK